jgi:hypothetical protein
MLLDLLMPASQQVAIVRGVQIGRVILNTPIDEVGVYGLALLEEGMEVFQLLGSIVVTDGLDLAQIQFQQSIPSEVLVEPAEAFPLHEEGLE